MENLYEDGSLEEVEIGYNDNDSDNQQKKLKVKGFRRTCFKVGVVFSVYFLLRMLIIGIMPTFYSLLSDTSDNFKFGMNMLLQTVCLYVIPLILCYLLFGKNKTMKSLYAVPTKLAKKIAMFPILYGASQVVNLATLGVMYLVSKFGGGAVDPIDSFNPSDSLPPNLTCGIMMAVMYVICAPLFEELIVRGFLMDELSKYGHGFAIVITAVIFGLIHGNFQQLFFATAAGLLLGYIRYASGSIFVTTILHAMMNAIAAGVILFASTEAIQDSLYNPTAAQQLTEQEQLLMSLFQMYMIFVFAFIIIGVVLLIKKIPTFRKYRVEHVWTDISVGKKYLYFFLSVSVIIMLVLAADLLFGNYVAGAIGDLLSGK